MQPAYRILSILASLSNKPPPPLSGKNEIRPHSVISPPLFLIFVVRNINMLLLYDIVTLICVMILSLLQFKEIISIADFTDT